MCTLPDVLDPAVIAGHACMLGGDSVGDSNFDFTSEKCAEQGGDWTSYDCEIADNHLKSDDLGK